MFPDCRQWNTGGLGTPSNLAMPENLHLWRVRKGFLTNAYVPEVWLRWWFLGFALGGSHAALLRQVKMKQRW